MVPFALAMPRRIRTTGRHMHYSSYDSMRRAVKSEIVRDPDLGQRPLRVLEVAGDDGSYESLFRFQPTDYVRVGVTGDSASKMRADPAGRLPLADRSFDVVVSGQTLQSVGTFWVLFAEMARVVTDDGAIIVAVPSAGDADRLSCDRYHFLPESMQSLADEHGLVIASCSRDARGPSRVLVTVFRRSLSGDRREIEPLDYVPSIDDDLQNDAPDLDLPEVELSAGQQPVIPKFLTAVHAAVEPRFYFETGVYRGASLVQAKCRSLGIDPAPIVSFTLKDFHGIHLGLSDDFFLDSSLTAQLGPLDLVYIDGMHLLENALMDFMNVEQHAHVGSVILVDDIYPNHPLQARRQRCSRHWTGDVWKIIGILERVRPDLIVLPIDTHPTGTLLVLGADPTNRALWDDFDLILEEALAQSEDPPDHILERRGVISPHDRLLWRLLRGMKAVRESDDPEAAFENVRRLVSGAMPRHVSRVSS